MSRLTCFAVFNNKEHIWCKKQKFKHCKLGTVNKRGSAQSLVKILPFRQSSLHFQKKQTNCKSTYLSGTCCPYTAMDSNFTSAQMIPSFIYPQKPSLLPLFPPTDCLTWHKTRMNNNFKLNCSKSEMITGLKSFLSPSKDFHSALMVTLSLSLPWSRTSASSWIPLCPSNHTSRHQCVILPPSYHSTSLSHRLLIHTFIISRLYYCNSLCLCPLICSSNPGSWVLNNMFRAARLLTHSCSREHITLILQHLHWLPIQHRMHSKILLTYGVRNSLPPLEASKTSSNVNPCSPPQTIGF